MSYINVSNKFEVLKINIEKMGVIKQRNDINDGLKKKRILYFTTFLEYTGVVRTNI